MDELEEIINWPWTNILALLGVVALVGSKYVPFIRRMVAGLLRVIVEMVRDPIMASHNEDPEAHGLLLALVRSQIALTEHQTQHEDKTATNGHPEGS